MSPFKRFVGGKLIPAIFVLLGALASWTAHYSYSNSHASNEWPLALGHVVAAKIDSTSTSSGSSRPNSTTYFPNLVYEYEVNGTLHEGWRITFGGYSFSDLDEVQAFLDSKYPKGSEVQVFYNPDKPRDSVLERGAHGFPWAFVIGGILFIGTGIVIYLLFPK